jgi:hypothetical protein
MTTIACRLARWLSLEDNCGSQCVAFSVAVMLADLTAFRVRHGDTRSHDSRDGGTTKGTIHLTKKRPR